MSNNNQLIDLIDNFIYEMRVTSNKIALKKLVNRAKIDFAEEKRISQLQKAKIIRERSRIATEHRKIKNITKQYLYTVEKHLNKAGFEYTDS